MIDKTLLEKRFSANAATYDRYANVQKIMARQLLERLQTKSIAPQRILEVGCGTGYLTKRLCRLFPNAQITAVDLAPGMLETARARLDGQSVEFVGGDIEEMELSGSFDLILSNATFQWFNQLHQTVRRLVECLSVGGALHFSTFGDTTFHELHTSFAKAAEMLEARVSAPGQSFYTLGELIALCEGAAGCFGRVNGQEWIEIEKFADTRAFFHSLRKIGANNSNAADYCQRPSLFRKMMRIYERDFRDDQDLVTATYHCLFISIEKRG
ncbi:malonyl-[acyl-carrier protein] O-methyltransferase BioC [Ammoniphilus oxalaticus]|uniref:Malonyl-[acyl-carrier protein] O-methyltransferase n=1 Tax=Ammoniphilus oxalaticus TaxID=66863 RepID=A0A419SN13_9BACL|nr:malonyl-ACP O-methyltransferase BioC [Ammoniphilus oxalaticus]RKD25609.1 malonyl-[acyl-carrier protein] O-methyltransferase BioC [Ammoniphilus oxalaticus]